MEMMKVFAFNMKKFLNLTGCTSLLLLISVIGLVQQPGWLLNKSCSFSVYDLQNCCFYKEVVQKLKFLNNSIDKNI